MNIEDLTALLSLKGWLERCERASVKAIPAKFSPMFPVKEVADAIDGNGYPMLAKALDWLKENLTEGYVWRWDFCSSGEVKYLLSKGNVGRSTWPDFTPDDPRFFDCTYGMTEDTCLAVRPWVEPLRIGGYPVEFRVFADGSGLLGVSSYYPQRPLPKTGAIVYLAEQVGYLAGRLEDRQKLPVGFTADFLVDTNLAIWFVDGGPPHLAEPEGFPSAHPCCFPPGKIHGLALAPLEGSVR